MFVGVAMLLLLCSPSMGSEMFDFDFGASIWNKELIKSLVTPMATEAQVRGYMLYSNGRADGSIHSVDATVAEIIRDVTNYVSNKAYLNIPPTVMDSDFTKVREWFTQQGQPIATLNSSSSVVTGFSEYARRLVASIAILKGTAYRRLSSVSVRSGKHRSLFNYIPVLNLANQKQQEWTNYLEANIFPVVYVGSQIDYHNAQINSSLASLMLFATTADMPAQL